MWSSKSSLEWENLGSHCQSFWIRICPVTRCSTDSEAPLCWRCTFSHDCSKNKTTLGLKLHEVNSVWQLSLGALHLKSEQGWREGNEQLSFSYKDQPGCFMRNLNKSQKHGYRKYQAHFLEKSRDDIFDCFPTKSIDTSFTSYSRNILHPFRIHFICSICSHLWLYVHWQSYSVNILNQDFELN